MLAYPQAPIEYDMYMELPAGIRTKYGDGRTNVLHLLKNLYGQKQAGKIWNDHLVSGLKEIGFVQSKIDGCLFYRGSVIFVVYVDDGIFASPNNQAIDQAIADLRAANYDIEDQGTLADYLGVNVETLKDGQIKLSQPLLIDQHLNDVRLPTIATKAQTPAKSTRILRQDLVAPVFDNRFNYRSVIGKLNFLEKTTRGDISYATHQVARFFQDPRVSHGEATEHLVRYLRATRTEGLILDPKEDKSIEVYADADFSGNWWKPTAMDDPSTAKSRSGYCILYAGCPIIWASKLQTIIALSSCEEDYISLSHSLRETIPLMAMINDIKNKGFNAYSSVPVV